MAQIKWLIYKDFKIDWRSKYPVVGLLLYVISLILTCYFAFTGFVQTETWNALFWVILLFVSINAIARSFLQEQDRTRYYFHIAKPETLIAAKLIYFGIYQLVLAGLGVFIFSVFMGTQSLSSGFYLNLVLGSLGLSSAFTMISSISSKTNNQSVMMAILGFPVIIPILVLAVPNSRILLLGGGIDDISGNLIGLFSVIVIIIAAIYILFPYTWKS